MPVDFEDPRTRLILSRTRSYKQFCNKLAELEHEQCPFCHLKPEVNELLPTSNELWGIWHNPFPYAHHEFHLVMAPRRHACSLTELTDEERDALLPTVIATLALLEIEAGAFVMRFGDPVKTSGTIEHLHGHIQVPDLTGPAKATFAKDLEKLEADEKRLQGFIARYEAGEVPED